MMGAMDGRNMYSNLAVSKYLHTVASRWISSTQNYDARNHEYKEINRCLLFRLISPFAVATEFAEHFLLQILAI